jgi:hypothetical protein
VSTARCGRGSEGPIHVRTPRMRATSARSLKGCATVP